MTSKNLVLTALVALGLVAACDPTAAPSSSYQAGPPIFAPPAVDAGTNKDAGTDAGTRDGGAPVDAGAPGDAGAPVDAGPPGLTIVSSNNHLPKPWVVTDPTVLVHTQPLGSGAPSLRHVGQLVQLAATTTSDNTVVDDDHCPDIFNGTCDGFAAKDSASHVVLVDTFVLLGKDGMAACSSVFNATVLTQITGVWVGRLLNPSMLTSYSLGLSSCSGVGQGTAYVGVGYAPATTDVQDLQANYPTSSPVVTVRGVVIAVQGKTVFIEDPGGGDFSGVQIFATSGYTSVPSVGDYVTVTGTASTRGDYNQILLP